jgi:hypothetical protein
MAVVQWTESFEGNPENTDDPSEGANRIRELKQTTRSIVDKEHVIDHDAGTVPVIAAQGWHREGSAVAYYQSAEPTNRPDGATSLDTDDDGRLWINPDDGTMDYWDGDSFEDLKVPEVDLIRDHLDKSADYTITDDDANTVFVTTSTSTITITLPTVADNTGRIITIKKVDSGSGKITIDGEGAETIDGSTTLDVENQYSLWSGFCDGSEWHTLYREANQSLNTTDDVEFSSITYASNPVSSVYTGSTYNNATFPIGTIILAYKESASTPSNNASVSVWSRGSGGNRTGYTIDSGSAFKQEALTGTWRVRGFGEGASGTGDVLLQRTA